MRHAITGLLLHHGLYPLQYLSRTRFLRRAKSMLKHDGLSAGQRHHTQAVALADILRHAFETVPRWRQLAEQVGILVHEVNPGTACEILRRLPITTKADYKRGFPKDVTSEVTREDLRYVQSSGTTDRVTVVQDFDKRDIHRACVVRSWKHLFGKQLGIQFVEIPPHACNVVCAMTDNGPQALLPFLWWALQNRRLGMNSLKSDLIGRIENRLLFRRTTLLPFEPRCWSELVPQLDAALDLIAAQKPTAVRGLPMFLMWLADRAAERECKFPFLSAVLPFGALTCDRVARRIEHGFGAPFVDYYGTSELAEVGCGRPGSSAVTVFDDVHLVEIVDDAGRPAPAGEIGRIVITDLHNRAMPLVRFALGDCGRFLDAAGSLLELHGREQERIPIKDGSTRSCRQLQDLVFSHPEVVCFRLEEDRGRFLLRIATRRDCDEDRIAAELGEFLMLSATPRIKQAPYLLPEASGKFLFYRRN